VKKSENRRSQGVIFLTHTVLWIVCFLHLSKHPEHSATDWTIGHQLISVACHIQESFILFNPPIPTNYLSPVHRDSYQDHTSQLLAYLPTSVVIVVSICFSKYTYIVYCRVFCSILVLHSSVCTSVRSQFSLVCRMWTVELALADFRKLSDQKTVWKFVMYYVLVVWYTFFYKCQQTEFN